MDPQLVEKMVHEVKSQGVFDEFRKDSMADVDTKPAYQNLRQRVENTVRSFLSQQKWTPQTNKNQLRDRLRRHITESGFLDVGVERIVDQVVNPKICTIFQPRIEDIAYKYLGVPLPPVKPPPPALIHPLPPLPLNGSLNVETANADLLPNDLEQVSPDSDKATVKSEIKEETSGFDDERIDDEDESPPFEPVGKCKSPETVTKTSMVKLEVDTENGLPLPSVSPVSRNNKVVHNHDPDETQDTIRSVRTAEFDSEKDGSRSLDAVAIESQLSQVSSDSQVSHTTPKVNDLDDEIKQSSGLEPAACNISEEAQMPKFNENSCDIKRVASAQLHFDINKDEIKFEGTERKNNITPVEQENVIREEKTNELETCIENRTAEEFSFNADVEPSQLPSERSICSSQDDSSSMHLVIVEKPKEELEKESSVTAEENSSMATTQQLSTQSDKVDNAKQSSSASHKKHHSKDKYRSHERDRPKDKDRQKDTHAHGERKGERSRHKSRERDHSKDKHSRSSKYSSSNSKHSSSTTMHRHDNILGSKSEKSITKSFHSSSSSSSSRGEKRNDTDKNDKNKGKNKTEKSDRKSTRDDHFESKEKPLRRRSTDSNDEDKSSTAPAPNNTTAVSNTKVKSKSSSETSGSSNSSTSNTVKGSANCNADMLAPPICCDISEATTQLSRNNRVVILNEILENPATSFIALEPNHMEVVMTNKSTNPLIPATSYDSEDNELYFFEKSHDDDNDFSTRIERINYAMNSYKQVMNSLRLESLHEDSNASDERTATRSTKRTAMMATLRVVDCQLDYGTTIEGTGNESSLPLKCGKLSPTASETSSGCSKENEAIDKNTMDSENGYLPLDNHKQSVGNKLNQQQRYSNDDLYKPRPIILSQRSKRRAVVVDSLI